MRMEIETIQNKASNREQEMGGLCYLFMVFLLGCLGGWIYEEIFYYITEGMLRNRGVLYGPWLPIYGIGILGIYLLKPFRKKPLFIFLLSVGISGIVEYVIGWIGIACFDLRLWDYRGEFANIGGIVCLRSVITFGICGLVFHYLAEPALRYVAIRMGRKMVCNSCVMLACLFLLDCVVSFCFRTPITY